MTRECFDKMINGRKVQVTEFDGEAGLHLFGRLMKLGIPGIGGAVGTMGASETGSSLMERKINIAAALAALADRIEPNDFVSLGREILSGTHVDMRDMSDDHEFRDAFAGRKIVDLFSIAVFVLESNYGDFIEPLRLAVIGALMPSGENQTVKQSAPSTRSSKRAGQSGD